MRRWISLFIHLHTHIWFPELFLVPRILYVGGDYFHHSLHTAWGLVLIRGPWAYREKSDFMSENVNLCDRCCGRSLDLDKVVLKVTTQVFVLSLSRKEKGGSLPPALASLPPQHSAGRRMPPLYLLSSLLNHAHLCSITIRWKKIWEMLKDRRAWSIAVHKVTKSETQLSDWTNTIILRCYPKTWIP